MNGTVWQERCAAVIELLERHFPEVRYQLTFRKDGDAWSMYAECRRNDHGSHHGTLIMTFVGPVRADAPEALPGLLLEKARERILEWQKDGFGIVKLRAEELEKSRSELDRRIGVNVDLDALEKRLESASP